MDSAEIVYATVDEIIGKTGKWSLLTHSHAFHVQAPEEVLHKLRLALSALKTEPSSETLRDPSERVMSSLSSSPNVKPEDSAEQRIPPWRLLKTNQILRTTASPHRDAETRLFWQYMAYWMCDYYYSTSQIAFLCHLFL